MYRRLHFFPKKKMEQKRQTELQELIQRRNQLQSQQPEQRFDEIYRGLHPMALVLVKIIAAYDTEPNYTKEMEELNHQIELKQTYLANTVRYNNRR